MGFFSSSSKTVRVNDVYQEACNAIAGFTGRQVSKATVHAGRISFTVLDSQYNYKPNDPLVKADLYKIESKVGLDYFNNDGHKRLCVLDALVRIYSTNGRLSYAYEIRVPVNSDVHHIIGNNKQVLVDHMNTVNKGSGVGRFDNYTYVWLWKYIDNFPIQQIAPEYLSGNHSIGRFLSIVDVAVQVPAVMYKQAFSLL